MHRRQTVAPNPQKHSITIEDLQYAAGFIDGDGSICSYRSKPKPEVYKHRPYHCAYVYATGSDLGVLEWFRNTFSGTINVARDRRAKRRNWRASYIWKRAVVANDTILTPILPFLILRRRQAELALELGERRNPRNGSTPVSDDEVAARESLHLAINEQNHNPSCPHKGTASIPYIAGLFDAEGNVGTVRSANGYRISACITNNCRCVLDSVQLSCGGAVRRGNGGWRWEIKGGAASRFLSSIEPYLTTKLQRAQLGIEFGKHVAQRWSKPTEENKRERDRIRCELLLLNQKGTQMSILPAV